MKYIYIIIAIFTIVSCKKENLYNKSSSINKFDEIIFYRVSAESEMSFLNDTATLNNKKSIQSLLFNSDSDYVLDSLKIAHLDRFYENITVDQKSFSQIAQIFEKAGYPINRASFLMTVCAPVYRDILVFKNNNVKVGYAKICFSCSQNKILIKDSYFVNSKLQYGELKTILDSLAIR
jgi:hypothetical protein